MKTLKLLLTLSIAVFMLSGFWSGKSDKEIKAENNESRKERLKTNKETLKKLYKYAPEAKK